MQHFHSKGIWYQKDTYYTLVFYEEVASVINCNYSDKIALAEKTVLVVSSLDIFQNSCLHPVSKWKSHSHTCLVHVSAQICVCTRASACQNKIRTALHFDKVKRQKSLMIVYWFILQYLINCIGYTHKTHIYIYGARSSIVAWGTTLQAGRLRAGIPIKSLDFSNDPILPAALWPWGRLSL
jgi:hypothetical protein